MMVIASTGGIKSNFLNTVGQYLFVRDCTKTSLGFVIDLNSIHLKKAFVCILYFASFNPCLSQAKALCHAKSNLDLQR